MGLEHLSQGTTIEVAENYLQRPFMLASRETLILQAGEKEGVLAFAE